MFAFCWSCSARLPLCDATNVIVPYLHLLIFHSHKYPIAAMRPYISSGKILRCVILKRGPIYVLRRIQNQEFRYLGLSSQEIRDALFKKAALQYACRLLVLLCPAFVNAESGDWICCRGQTLKGEKALHSDLILRI